MNKLTKAAIAGAAGIALLLGGAGSLAYWNDSVAMTGAQIDSGSLDVSIDSGSWAGAPAGKWVPGDSATFTGKVKVTAVGTNFKGKLTADTSALTGGNLLAQALVVNTTITPQAGISAAGVISAPGTYTVDVVVSVSFPFGTAVDNSTQSLGVNLSDIAFNVVQTP